MMYVSYITDNLDAYHELLEDEHQACSEAKLIRDVTGKEVKVYKLVEVAVYPKEKQ